MHPDKSTPIQNPVSSHSRVKHFLNQDDQRISKTTSFYDYFVITNIMWIADGKREQLEGKHSIILSVAISQYPGSFQYSGFLPTEIRKKTEEIIDHIIHAHKLDISKLRLNARIIVYSDINGKWSNEISVVISDYSVFDDTWIEEEYSIGYEDPLYVPLKTYLCRMFP